MIFADPPYFLSNGGITCHAGKRVKVDKGSWDKSGGAEANHEFNQEWLRRCQRVLKPNGSIWVTGTLHVIFSVGYAMQQLGFKLLNDISWEKPNPPPNLSCRFFTHSTETVLWAAKDERSKHYYNYKLMRELNGGKQMKTVWTMTAPANGEKRVRQERLLTEKWICVYLRHRPFNFLFASSRAVFVAVFPFASIRVRSRLSLFATHGGGDDIAFAKAVPWRFLNQTYRLDAAHTRKLDAGRMSLPCKKLGALKPKGFDADQHFAFVWFRDGTVLDLAGEQCVCRYESRRAFVRADLDNGPKGSSYSGQRRKPRPHRHAGIESTAVFHRKGPATFADDFQQRSARPARHTRGNRQSRGVSGLR